MRLTRWGFCRPPFWRWIGPCAACWGCCRTGHLADRAACWWMAILSRGWRGWRRSWGAAGNPAGCEGRQQEPVYRGGLNSGQDRSRPAAGSAGSAISGLWLCPPQGLSGTKAHSEALARHGPCPASPLFRPVARLLDPDLPVVCHSRHRLKAGQHRLCLLADRCWQGGAACATPPR